MTGKRKRSRFGVYTDSTETLLVLRRRLAGQTAFLARLESGDKCMPDRWRIGMIAATKRDIADIRRLISDIEWGKNEPGTDQ